MSAAAVPLVIDASTVLAAASADEPGHADALDFMHRIHDASQRQLVRLHEPRQWMFEIFAATQRQRGRRDYNLLSFMPQDAPLHFANVELTDDDVGRVLKWHHDNLPGSKPHVKGGDLVYLAMAWRVGCTLVALDAGLLKYPGVSSPGDYTKRHLMVPGAFTA